MKHVLICGAGAIGLCCALFLLERGYQVTVIDRDSAESDGCSFGNAGMIVPSHFTPLTAPGVIGLGLRWMLDPASPFYIRPRFDTALRAQAIAQVRPWAGCVPARPTVYRTSVDLRDTRTCARPPGMQRWGSAWRPSQDS